MFNFREQSTCIRLLNRLKKIKLQLKYLFEKSRLKADVTYTKKVRFRHATVTHALFTPRICNNSQLIRILTYQFSISTLTANHRRNQSPQEVIDICILSSEFHPKGFGYENNAWIAFAATCKCPLKCIASLLVNFLLPNLIQTAGHECCILSVFDQIVCDEASRQETEVLIRLCTALMFGIFGFLYKLNPYTCI